MELLLKVKRKVQPGLFYKTVGARGWIGLNSAKFSIFLDHVDLKLPARAIRTLVLNQFD